MRSERRQKCSDIADRHVIELAARWHEAICRGEWGDDAPPRVWDSWLDEGWHPNVAWAKLVRLGDRGLLDCGVNEKGSWPTPEGMKLLDADLV